MKKRARMFAVLGAALLLVAFVAPPFGMAFRGGHRAEATGPDGGETAPTYWSVFRRLAPLTYTAFILGILALCAAILLWLVLGWVNAR